MNRRDHEPLPGELHSDDRCRLALEVVLRLDVELPAWAPGQGVNVADEARRALLSAIPEHARHRTRRGCEMRLDLELGELEVVGRGVL